MVQLLVPAIVLAQAKDKQMMTGLLSLLELEPTNCGGRLSVPKKKRPVDAFDLATVSEKPVSFSANTIPAGVMALISVDDMLAMLEGE